MTDQAKQQSYDNLLKRLVYDQPEVVLPLLFPELAHEVVEELNVELLIPPRRTDRVYKTRPEDTRRGLEILHVEFEAAANHKMDTRLLIYHALLFEKYELPVRSIIIYPFQVSMVSSPLREHSGEEEILSFRFGTLPLWKLDARQYLKRQAVPLYGLLPAMGQGNQDLLLQAIEEMLHYYQGNEDLLRAQLLCFLVLLTRAQRLPEAERLAVERRIHMFDPLLEQDPWVQEKRAESKIEGLRQGKIEGKLEGKLEGRLEASRNILLKIVRKRFPTLTALAEERVEQMTQPEMLDELVEGMLQASSAEEAQALLTPTAAS